MLIFLFLVFEEDTGDESSDGEDEAELGVPAVRFRR